MQESTISGKRRLLYIQAKKPLAKRNDDFGSTSGII